MAEGSRIHQLHARAVCQIDHYCTHRVLHQHNLKVIILDLRILSNKIYVYITYEKQLTIVSYKKNFCSSELMNKYLFYLRIITFNVFGK